MKVISAGIMGNETAVMKFRVVVTEQDLINTVKSDLQHAETGLK